MNDKEALTAINAAIDKWIRGEEREFETLARIARITGENANAA